MAKLSDAEEIRWFWDEYIDWSRHLRENKMQNSDREFSVPIFLRVKQEIFDQGLTANLILKLLDIEDAPTEGEIDQQVIDFFLNLKNNGKIKFDAHEIETIRKRNSNPSEFFCYVLESWLIDNHEILSIFFTLLDVGGAVLVNQHFLSPPIQVSQSFTQTAMVAVIDDGIGFLNKRFSMPGSLNKETRFEGFWLQAKERSVASDSSVKIGQVFSKQDIDDILIGSEPIDEFLEYQKLNRKLLDSDTHRSTEFSFSHGTHVFDLAAGADPEIEQLDWPLLGVQLPAGSIEDTSGTYFETHVVMAVRWILFVASTANIPLVINISLGILAGPKNGTKFMEYQIAREIEFWQIENNQRVRVVYAFGNDRRNNQVARFENLPIKKEQTIDWIIQPDDFTSNYVEIHHNSFSNIPKGLEIKLESPDGHELDFQFIEPASYSTLYNAFDKPIARIYHVPSRLIQEDTDISEEAYTRAHYAIAVAPTESRELGDLKARSGSWRISLRNLETEALDITLQIQRSDSAPGYDYLGRQSYFDHEGAYGWDEQTQEYTSLYEECPITNEGSNSALTTARKTDNERNEMILDVGGAVYVSNEETPRPAKYTSIGASWSDGAPSNSAISEDGYATHGVLASGTYSGSVQSMNGTSVAAARVTRWLAQEFAKGEVAPIPSSPSHTDSKAEDLFSLGEAILVEQGGARKRH